MVGGKIALPTDVSVYADCERLAQATVDAYGRIDILVSNAGILRSGDIYEFDPDDWKRVIEVNLCGAFNIMKAVAPQMLAQKSGSIIQINSKSGKKGSYKSSAYAASKFGGIGLVQSLALEFASQGVRVNAICPGNLLDSPLWQNSLIKQYSKNRGITEQECYDMYLKQIPMGRTCLYSDVANVMVFLASDQSSYMTGQALNVTGGFEMR